MSTTNRTILWSLAVVTCCLGATLWAVAARSNPATTPSENDHSLPQTRPTGNVVDHTAAHFYNAFRYAASADTTVNVIRIKMASAGIGDLACAIYSDKQGTPGKLLSATAPISDPPAGWQTLALREPIAVKTGEQYWLVDLKEFAADISCSNQHDVPALFGALIYGRCRCSRMVNPPTCKGAATLSQHLDR